jgi:hypothetical protein
VTKLIKDTRKSYNGREVESAIKQLQKGAPNLEQSINTIVRAMSVMNDTLIRLSAIDAKDDAVEVEAVSEAVTQAVEEVTPQIAIIAEPIAEAKAVEVAGDLADTAESNAKAYADSQDSANLVAAKGYTDTETAGAIATAAADATNKADAAQQAAENNASDDLDSLSIELEESGTGESIITEVSKPDTRTLRISADTIKASSNKVQVTKVGNEVRIDPVSLNIGGEIPVTSLAGTPFDVWMVMANDGVATVNGVRAITLNDTFEFSGSSGDLEVENSDTVRLKTTANASRWLVIGNVTTYLSSGSTRSQSFCDFERANDGTQGGGAGSSIANTTAWMYNRETIEGFATGTTMYLFDLNPGDGVRLRAGRSSGDATNIRIKDDSTRFLWIKIKDNE